MMEASQLGSLSKIKPLHIKLMRYLVPILAILPIRRVL